MTFGVAEEIETEKKVIQVKGLQTKLQCLTDI